MRVSLFTTGTVLGGFCLALIGCQAAPPPPPPSNRNDPRIVNVQVEKGGNVAVSGGGVGVAVRPNNP